MDNNNNSSIQPNIEPVVTQPTMSTAPVAPQAAGVPPQKAEGNKMVLWLIGGFIIVILLVGIIYYFLSSTQKKTEEASTSSTPAPVSKVVEDVNESDVEGVSLNSLDAEFQSVDSDLKSL